MAKIRSGIDIPIIPEDFIDSEEEIGPDILESYLEWAYQCIQDGVDLEYWRMVGKDFDPIPQL
jgi:hypothetical protein